MISWTRILELINTFRYGKKHVFISVMEGEPSGFYFINHEKQRFERYYIPVQKCVVCGHVVYVEPDQINTLSKERTHGCPCSK